MNLDFLSGIGDAIGSFFATPIVQLGLKAIGIYIVIVWLAAAFWAFRDMQLRTANPIVPYLAAAFVIGFTPVLFLFAVLVYKIIRPQERLGEAYERGLRPEGPRGMDPLPNLPDAPQARLPELQPAGGIRVVPLRVVRPRLRAPDRRGRPRPDVGSAQRGCAGAGARTHAGRPGPRPPDHPVRGRRDRAQPDPAALNPPAPAARGVP